MYDEKAYNRVHHLARYHRVMEWARALLGGKCAVCEVTVNLEIDHIDPATKSFTISMNWGAPKEVLTAELAKCQLLCEAHHTQKTAREQRKGHGTWGAYRRQKCRCDTCRAFVREYQRKYKKPRTKGRSKCRTK